MSSTTIGTCGACGGRVSIPSAWMGVNPPIPTCDSCGRSPRHAHGPVIDMESMPRKAVNSNQISPAEYAIGRNDDVRTLGAAT